MRNGCLTKVNALDQSRNFVARIKGRAALQLDYVDNYQFFLGIIDDQYYCQENKKWNG